MTPHVDIWEDREPIRKPLLGSLALHLSITGALIAGHFLGKSDVVRWGDPNSFGGGTVGVNVVKQIPLPGRSGQINPVANDTESRVPTPKEEAKPQPREVREDPNAITLKGRNAAKKRPPAASPNKFRAAQQDKPNQLYSSAGQALVSPLVGAAGSGGIGVGTGSPFGDRFGWYVDLLRQRVAQKWRTTDIDARIQQAPPAIVTFTIQKNGSARDIRIVQTSGNSLLDLSAQRAVAEASPFPQLPPGFERDSARIEFQFFLRR